LTSLLSWRLHATKDPLGGPIIHQLAWVRNGILQYSRRSALIAAMFENDRHRRIVP
jgi:hypothetical protein